MFGINIGILLGYFSDAHCDTFEIVLGYFRDILVIFLKYLSLYFCTNFRILLGFTFECYSCKSLEMAVNDWKLMVE